MKCFIVLAAFAACASAQYYLPDTADVAHAKRVFADAYNAALARNGPYQQTQAYATNEGDFQDGQTYPAAVPYVHEEVPAEPYVHYEPPRRRGGKPVAAAPQQPAQLAYQQQAYQQPAPQAVYQQAYTYQQPQQQYYNNPVVYNNQPAGYAGPVWQGGCYNNRGEGVECRTDFSENLQQYY